MIWSEKNPSTLNFIRTGPGPHFSSLALLYTLCTSCSFRWGKTLYRGNRLVWNVAEVRHLNPVPSAGYHWNQPVLIWFPTVFLFAGSTGSVSGWGSDLRAGIRVPGTADSSLAVVNAVLALCSTLGLAMGLWPWGFGHTGFGHGEPPAVTPGAFGHSRVQQPGIWCLPELLPLPWSLSPFPDRMHCCCTQVSSLIPSCLDLCNSSGIRRCWALSCAEDLAHHLCTAPQKQLLQFLLWRGKGAGNYCNPGTMTSILSWFLKAWLYKLSILLP